MLNPKDIDWVQKHVSMYLDYNWHERGKKIIATASNGLVIQYLLPLHNSESVLRLHRRYNDKSLHEIDSGLRLD